MKAIIAGASAGLGRSLAEALGANGYDLLLIAGDVRDLQALAAHLRLVCSVRVEVCAVRIDAVSAWLDPLRSAIQRFGPVDTLLLPIGLSRNDDDGSLALDALRDIFEANLIGIMAIVELVLPTMERAGKGCIAGFGSIAAARGRSQNVAYAAAKRGLASYFQSLRHRLGGTGVAAQFFIIGYMSSQQSFGKKLLLPVATTEAVAARVLAAMRLKGPITAHLPSFWWAVEVMIRIVPWRIFNRMKA